MSLAAEHVALASQPVHTWSHLGPAMAAGFVVAFLHTALPTHWLPFVLAARLRQWTTMRTLGVAILAAFAHVAATALLGALLTGLGLALQQKLGGAFALIVAVFMGAVGLWLVVQSIRHGHHHHHHHGKRRNFGTDRSAIIGLMLLMLLSPCEAFLPVYLADVRLGWAGFGILSAVLAVATVSGMAFFVMLSLAGAARLRLEKLERYESAIIGLALMLLGLVVLVVER